MTVEEALEFVKNSNEDDWNLLTTEMSQTRQQRDLAAAEGLSIGEWVVFEPPDPKGALKGRIIKIARGRVTLAYLSQRSGSIRRVEVPARMVSRDVRKTNNQNFKLTPLELAWTVATITTSSREPRPLFPAEHIVPYFLVTALFFLWGVPNNTERRSDPPVHEVFRD